MKQFFMLCALCLRVQLAFAQVSITEAPDFTLTDIHGGEHHLYELLNDGKYVMIKLYAHWCGPCCATAPAVKQVYENFGCNSGDLVVIGLEADGTLAQTEEFENNCGAAGVTLIAGFEAQPNPFTETLSITGTIAKPAHVQMEVLNALGQIVLQHDAGQWTAGEHTTDLPAAQLPQGHYFVHLLANGVPAATLNVQK
jgi:thiol-disulfide isomerase/thioredoxin